MLWTVKRKIKEIECQFVNEIAVSYESWLWYWKPFGYAYYFLKHPAQGIPATAPIWQINSKKFVTSVCDKDPT